MWLVDDGFLQGVASGESPWVRTVEVPRNQPYFDIEAVADVRQDRPGEGGFRERFRRLRPWVSEVLAVPGNHDIAREPGERTSTGACCRGSWPTPRSWTSRATSRSPR